MAPDGLLETDLAGLLRRPGEVVLPGAVWAGLFVGLKAFLRVLPGSDAKVNQLPVFFLTSGRFPNLPTVASAIAQLGRDRSAPTGASRVAVGGTPALPGSGGRGGPGARHAGQLLSGSARPCDTSRTLGPFWWTRSRARSLMYQMGPPFGGWVRLDQADEDRTRPVNVRALRDVVYHLLEAGRKSEATGLLEDLVFLELRCRAGQLQDLLGDLDRVLSGTRRRNPAGRRCTQPIDLTAIGRSSGRSDEYHQCRCRAAARPREAAASAVACSQRPR